MKKIFLILLLASFGDIRAQDEVFYHVFQRSFFDSDGDGDGDLNGMRAKLDYLQDLGVNTLLLTPLYASDFYHNYFAYDFEAIDPEYGTAGDYLMLVKEVHKRGMKIYQDVEMQYVAGTHPWFKEGFENPQSRYARYLYYHDVRNEQPFYFWNFPEFTIYNGQKQKIITVNLKEKEVWDYTLKVLKYWADPNADGRFSDGVDGFRLDHMMDDLDNAGKLTNLFRDFWSPLFAALRGVNPNLKFVAEQADWGSYGRDYFTEGHVDFVFAFRLKFAIGKFDKAEIEKAADSTFNHNPAGKNQLVFIENHDTRRFASEQGVTPEKAKCAASVMLLIGGIPSIYYGQEIGMKGEQRQLGMTDGNDIGVRESFEWYKDEHGEGTADWYKNTGPWWDQRFNKPGDGISVEEQENDPDSLLNAYRDLLALRKEYPALTFGRYENAETANASVLGFYRAYKSEKCLVLVNLSHRPQDVSVVTGPKPKLVYGQSWTSWGNKTLTASLAPYQTLVLTVN
jgi:glycosidase